MNGSMTVAMDLGLALLAMLPEHLLLMGAVLLLGLDIAGKGARLALSVAIAFVAAGAIAAVVMGAQGISGEVFPGLLAVSPSVLLAKGVLLGLAVPVLLMSRDDFEGGEFPALVLLSLCGISLLLSAESLLISFLGLELMSIPVYALIVLGYRRPESAEASLKYLVLGGTGTAMFLMGVALLFDATGSMALDTFAAAMASPDLVSRAAVVLILLAFFIKAAIVPFHAWAPDAYETASLAVTAYMATIIKGGVLLAIARIIGPAPITSPMVELLVLFPLVSIVWGNLTAMRQGSFRRMIAYSSIAHAGYLFYAMLGDGAGRFAAMVFYVLVYGVVNVLAFAALPAAHEDRDRDQLEQLEGLYHRQPFAALVIGVAMLSLAGLPPFPGFVAKFLIFKNVLAAGYGTYAVLGLVGSYVGIYFYLRVIQLMFMSRPAQAHGADFTIHPNPRPPLTTSGFAHSAAVLCLMATLLLAVLPGWVLAHL